MAFPLAPVIIGGGLVVSVTTNIIQGVQKNKLRKQIEKLLEIIDNLNSDINEFKKERKATKIWHFKEKLILTRKIKTLKRKLAGKYKEIEVLRRKLR